MNSPTSPLQHIQHSLFKHHNIDVFIKRDDLIHPIISGNKWRKLKYNMAYAKAQNKTQIISFGGAYSNHIHALAYACKLHQLKGLAIIRGEAHYQSNFTLSWAQHWGLALQFVNRLTYKERGNAEFLQNLQHQYPDALIVPEGGSNHLALPGVGEVISELNQQTDFDYLLTPVGSGGTLAGLALADKGQHKLLGIAVLKQDGYLEDQVNALLADKRGQTNNWQVLNQFHDGGYGKFSKDNAERIALFSKQTGIPFEPVYSGKMLIALLDLLKQGYFKPNSKLVLLHTGGIQGLGGMCERGILDKADWPVPEPAPNS